MPEFTGKSLYLAFKGTQLQADFRQFGVTEDVGLADATAGSDAARTYIKTLEDGRGVLSLLMQTGGTAATSPAQLLAPGAEGTLEWGPEGNGTGKPRRYVNAIVRSYEERSPYDDMVEINAVFQFSGQITRTAY